MSDIRKLKRIKEVGKLLGPMVAIAKTNFPRCRPMQLHAVLSGWSTQAMVISATPEMVDRVERELAK